MKIIFSDLDGTLLQRGEKALNKNIKKSIYKILESGNFFSVSSGRSYIELKEFFKEFDSDIIYICNDGSLTVFKEQTLLARPMDKTMFNEFKEYTAHGKYVTYVKSSNALTLRNTMRQYRNHVMMIDNISDIKEDIYKISDLDRSIPCPLPVVYKNLLMNEYIAEGADKSEAVRHILSSFNIKKSDSFAFGDNTNDLGMFKVCGTSYAAAGARPDIKKCADKTVYNIENEFCKIIGG